MTEGASPEPEAEGLNEVRPRRPEQCDDRDVPDHRQSDGLNEVRPRRPEQSGRSRVEVMDWVLVSMKSGLEGRNNLAVPQDA